MQKKYTSSPLTLGIGFRDAMQLFEGLANQKGGGSEWVPIKILLEGDKSSNKTNTASNTLH
jgi:hypothetical protein